MAWPFHRVGDVEYHHHAMTNPRWGILQNFADTTWLRRETLCRFAAGRQDQIGTQCKTNPGCKGATLACQRLLT
jgi:hypothetical protein